MNIINIVTFKKISPKKTNIKNIFISVLIPVRNEEENIKRCMESILKQDYEFFELIILNDNSTDNTLEILKSFNDSRIKVINGEPLPENWIGKNFACHQLQKLAKGDYLLFTDADTVMNKKCISYALNFAIENETDLLTIIPKEISITFWEKLVIPMLYFALMIFLPIPLIERSKLKQFSMGNGQFMLFNKKFYDKINGHQSIKNSIVEDVWLARRVKEFGGKLVFGDGTNIIKCRMYKNLDEIWNGFSKNVFASLSFSFAGLILITILYLNLFIVPYFLLWHGYMISDLFIITLSLVSIIIPIIIRITQSIRFKQPVIFSFINSLSCIFIICVSINSYLVLKFGKGPVWKGRQYQESLLN